MFRNRATVVARIVFLIVLLVSSFDASCIKVVRQTDKEQPSQAAEQTEPPPEKYIPPRLGSLTTGPELVIGTRTVTAAGANITVKQPGDPVDGTKIFIPPNSYANPTTFKVTSAPITGNTFPHITPISPLITIDNGGGYAEGIMKVTIPVKIPPGYFAMGFFYDKELGRLEGMPLVEETPTSVTVATRHFCDFFISMIKIEQLQGKIDSGFKPGVDDWQFENLCSYIEPPGHCAGQSITAMWYYCTRPDGAKVHLYGKYDNYGKGKPTTDFWQDDTYAYRLCSVIQNSVKWDNTAQTYFADFKLVPDELTLKASAYAIKVTGEPQLVCILSNAGGGHAMVVYLVDYQSHGALWVADPNYPSKETRLIEYYNGTFTPYSSALNAEELAKGKGQKFETIRYYGKSAIFDWPLIGDKWQEMKNKTIGNGVFPAFKIGYKDKDNKFCELKEGTSFSEKYLRISVDFDGLQFSNCPVFRNGQELKASGFGYELNPGKNVLGIWVQRVPPGKDKTKYIDFQYITVYLGGLTIDPPSLEGESGKEYTFTAKTDSPLGKARYEWAVDGAAQKTTGNVLKYTLGSKPSYTITCKLFDDAVAGGKLMGDASATATIKTAATPGTKLRLRVMDNPPYYAGKEYVYSFECQYDFPVGARYKCLIDDPNSGFVVTYYSSDGTRVEHPYNKVRQLTFSVPGPVTVTAQLHCKGDSEILAQDQKSFTVLPRPPK